MPWDLQAIDTSNEFWGLLQHLYSCQILTNSYLGFDGVKNLSVLPSLRPEARIEHANFAAALNMCSWCHLQKAAHMTQATARNLPEQSLTLSKRYFHHDNSIACLMTEVFTQQHITV